MATVVFAPEQHDQGTDIRLPSSEETTGDDFSADFAGEKVSPADDEVNSPDDGKTMTQMFGVGIDLLEKEMLSKLLPKKSTLKVFWQTLSITLINLAYFCGGFYLLAYHLNEDEALRTRNAGLLKEKEEFIIRLTGYRTERTLKSRQYYTVPPLLDVNSSDFCKLGNPPNRQICSRVMHISNTLDLLCRNSTRRWDGFWVALDFTSTIMSTVGYGYVAPKTLAGRIFVLVYGIGAISLYIIFLGVLGDYVTQGMEKLNFCTCKNVMLELVIKYFTILVVVFGFIALQSYIAYYASRQISADFIEANMEPPMGNWTIKDSVYYSIVSLMTIGFGDLYTAYPQRERWKALLVFLLVSIGLALFSYGYNTYVAASERRIQYLKAKAEKMARIAAKNSIKMAQMAAGKAGGVAGNMAGKAGNIAINVAGKAGGMAGNMAGKAGGMAGNVAGNITNVGRKISKGLK